MPLALTPIETEPKPHSGGRRRVNPRLTAAQRQAIVDRDGGGYTRKMIAAEFGVTVNYISALWFEARKRRGIPSRDYCTSGGLGSRGGSFGAEEAGQLVKWRPDPKRCEQVLPAVLQGSAIRPPTRKQLMTGRS